MKGRLFHALFQEQKDLYTEMHMTVTGILAMERIKNSYILPYWNNELKNNILKSWNFLKMAMKTSCVDNGVKFSNSKCNWSTGAGVPIYVLGHILYGAKVSGETIILNQLKTYFRTQEVIEKPFFNIHWNARPGEKPCEGYWECYHRSSNDVELTSYVLLSTMPENTIRKQDVRIMRYLQSKRNKQGGWSSTQDTMMAMTALSVFAKRMGSKLEPYVKNKNIKVSYEIDGIKDSLTIDGRNSGYVKKIEAEIGQKIENVVSKGEGCLLAQTNVFYNIEEVEEDLNLGLSFDEVKGWFGIS